MDRIKKYCITNGTVNRAQQVLFEGGSVNGQADISYAVKEAYSLMSRGGMSGYQSFQYAASFSGFIFKSMYCYGKSMFQNASGREISCYQLMFCAKEDLRGHGVFLNEVIRFPYLSLDELLKSDEYRSEQIFNRPGRENCSEIEFSKNQQNNFIRVAAALLQRKRVVLQIPGGVLYEEMSLRALEEVFRLIPQRDCCEISFSTARNAGDIRRLNNSFNLVLTDDQTQPFGDDVWISLNDTGELNEAEESLRLWKNESEDNRHAVEQNLFGIEPAKKTHVDLKTDFQVIQTLYSASSAWWKKEEPERRMRNFSDMISEYHQNPLLVFPENRKAFFAKSPKLIDRTGMETVSDEEFLIDELLDYLVQEQESCSEDLTASFVEDPKALDCFRAACAEEYDWFGQNESWKTTFLNEMTLLQHIWASNATE